MASLRYSFAGMQRVGNHATINWWMKHFSAWVVRNNILGLRYDDEAAQSQNGINTVSVEQTEEVHIDTWENYFPNDIFVHPDSKRLIVIIRDPYNWWASWFKYTIKNPNIQDVALDQTIDSYMAYVDYARTTNRWISFNRWFSDVNYRRSLECSYGLRKSDVGLQELMYNKNEFIGNGSTFDGVLYHNQAQNMKVLTRYERFLDDDEYITPLRQHPELADVARELFNMEPPKGIHI